MISPVETLADALIAFILSLLKDPQAADDFLAEPESTLAGKGLSGVCMGDVTAVRPVIVDRPDVVPNVTPPPITPRTVEDHTIREIVRMVQQYTTIDARSTIVDQSVNQNIWTNGGDVMQIFDQEAVTASGDGALAGGDDVQLTDTDTDITVGDVSIGNDTYDGSFNQTGDGNVGPVIPEDADDTTTPDTVDGAVDAAVDTATDTADATAPADDAATAPASDAPVADTAPPAPADVPEPADLLESDMTAGGGDTYEADAASAAVSEQPADLPVEDD